MEYSGFPGALKIDPVHMLPAYAEHAKFMLKRIIAKAGKAGRYM